MHTTHIRFFTFFLFLLRLRSVQAFFFFLLSFPPLTARSNPDPTRFENEITAFRAWDLKNSFRENAILFVGSSSIRLWKTAASFPGFPVMNRGFGGAHISDILYYYDDVVGKYNPRVIVFYCGDNDVADKKPVDQVVNDYQTFLDRIQKDFPEASIIYLPIKPSRSRWNVWPQMKKVNEHIEELHAGSGHLYYVDTATPLLDASGAPDATYFMEDALHLNDRGYDLWDAVIGPVLDEVYK